MLRPVRIVLPTRMPLSLVGMAVINTRDHAKLPARRLLPRGAPVLRPVRIVLPTRMPLSLVSMAVINTRDHAKLPARRLLP